MIFFILYVFQPAAKRPTKTMRQLLETLAEVKDQPEDTTSPPIAGEKYTKPIKSPVRPASPKVPRIIRKVRLKLFHLKPSTPF